MINKAAAPVSRASRPTPSSGARPVRSRSAAATVAAATPQARRRIGLAFPGGPSHWHDVHRGIADWARDKGWQVFADAEAPRPLAWWLRQPLDGLIAAVTTRAEARAAQAARIPVVNVSQVLPTVGLSLVTFDNEAIGRQAADHFFAAGYLRGAFFGLAGGAYARQRHVGFADRLAAAGIGCEDFQSRADADLASWQAIDGWLESLPPGTGVFAAHDRAATFLLAACRRLAIDVPGRLGVLGVGEDPESQALASPTLSSIGRNGAAVGRAACDVLDRLLVTGRLEPLRPVLIAPAGVSPRESTARRGGDVVGQAVAYIRDHIGEPFDVEHLTRKLRVSRRTLEKAFRSATGNTPLQQLHRMRAEAALAARAAAPGMTLAAVAQAAGFTSVRHLHRTFAALGLEPLAASPRRGRLRRLSPR
jgi:DNA-binding LacI/PurR family transcriptional regulator